MNLPNYLRWDRWLFAVALLFLELALTGHAWAQG